LDDSIWSPPPIINTVREPSKITLDIRMLCKKINLAFPSVSLEKIDWVSIHQLRQFANYSNESVGRIDGVQWNTHLFLILFKYERERLNSGFQFDSWSRFDSQKGNVVLEKSENKWQNVEWRSWELDKHHRIKNTVPLDFKQRDCRRHQKQKLNRKTTTNNKIVLWCAWEMRNEMKIRIS
jgi:hypothetical protein